MDDELVLGLAKREATDLPVQLVVVSADGDGYVVDRVGEQWRVTGNNARSCLWGVYHLQAGGEAGAFRPRFAVRGVNVCESLSRHTAAQVERFIDRMARWRMNRLAVHPSYGYRRHGELIRRCCAERGIELVLYVQSSLLFLGDATAELFAKDEHGQPRTKTLENETRLCSCHAEARATFAEGARRYLAGDDVPPGSRLIVIDADGYEFCACSECRKLTPVEQWERLFELVQDAAKQTGKGLIVQYLAYVWRYRLPTRERVMRRLDGVLFDTHQRFRWKPIGEPHDLTYYNTLESRSDPRAGDIPLNVYLRDRLIEWRDAVSGELCIFENLMLQGSISCPQPYTPQLLADLDLYERLGVDGVIYEAFEPGIASFAPQLDLLSRALWEGAPPYEPTDLERACASLTEADAPAYHFKNCFNVLSYLTTSRFDGPALLREHIDDPVLWAYADHLRAFLQDRSLDRFRRVVEHIMSHRDRFDWMFIAFNLARAVEPPLIGTTANAKAERMLTVDKLWDMLEAEDDPQSFMQQVIRDLCMHQAAHDVDLNGESVTCGIG